MTSMSVVSDEEESREGKFLPSDVFLGDVCINLSGNVDSALKVLIPVLVDKLGSASKLFLCLFDSFVIFLQVFVCHLPALGSSEFPQIVKSL